MSNWQRLWRVQLIGLTGLLVFAGMLSVFLLVEDLFFSSGEDAVDLLLVTFGLTFFYGGLPVILLGAPLYVALTSSGSLRWTPMLAVALLPGAALFVIDRGVGLVGMLAGLFVLAFTHRLAERWTRVA